LKIKHLILNQYGRHMKVLPIAGESARSRQAVPSDRTLSGESS